MTAVFSVHPVLVPNLEEEAVKLRDKDGWIKIHDYMKFAMTTELCKIEFQDRVFHKVDWDEERKKTEAARKDSKAKVLLKELPRGHSRSFIMAPGIRGQGG
jgi:hypothetical protein